MYPSFLATKNMLPWKNMKPKKILGWILITFGLVIIGGSLYFSFTIFTGKAVPPTVFEVAEQEPSTAATQNLTEEELTKLIQEQVRGMIPTEMLSQLLNLLAWSVFVGLLIFGGGKLASIGIKLSKE